MRRAGRPVPLRRRRVPHNRNLAVTRPTPQWLPTHPDLPYVIRMHLTPADKNRVSGTFSVVREPARPDVAAQSDPAVIATVSSMLSDIEQHGLAAVRRYAEQLDGWTGGEDFEIPADQVGALTASLPQDLRDALDAGG